MAENTANPSEFNTLYPDTLKPDAAVATGFLVDFASGGPITVVMIPAEGPGARARTFDTSDRRAVDEMRSFIASHESMPFNVFYMANRAADNTAGVPSNEDVAEIRAVVLDFDPKKDHLLADERTRLRRFLFDMVDLLQPWAVVDTGGGMQVVFKLSPAVAMPLEEFGARADEHEAFLKRLARALGADTATCKLKNLFRVPGTYNWPTAAKKAAGRDRSVSGVWYRSETKTTLEALGRWCAVRPEDVSSAPKDGPVDFNGLTEADLIHVLKKPAQLPTHLITLIQSSPVLERAIRAVGANPADTSKDDYKLSLALVRFGLALPDIALILCAFGAKVERMLRENRLFGYVRGTIAKAVRDAGIDLLDGYATTAEAEEAKAAHKERIRFMPPDKLTAGIFDEQSVGIVAGLLGARETTVIYGKSGSGKTFVALDLCYRISLGLEWCGRKTRACRVAYVAAESPNSVRRRVAALVQTHGMSAAFLTDTEGVDMFDIRVDFAKLLEALDAVRPDVIVFDTLARVNSGNENSAQDMGALISNGDKLRDRYGANIIWVHHSGKDESLGARGSSALRAATDTEIEIVDASKFRVTKLRDGELFGVEFGLKEIEIGRMPDHSAVTTCVVTWRGDIVTTSDPAAKLRDQVRIVLEQIGQPATIREIAQHGKSLDIIKMRVSPSAIRLAITRAIEKSVYFRDYPTEKGFEKRYGLLSWAD